MSGRLPCQGRALSGFPSVTFTTSSKGLYVGIQDAKNSENFGPIRQSLKLNTVFDLRPWEKLPNLSARSENIDL